VQLPVEEVQLSVAGGARELLERVNPRHYALDVTQAPLQRMFVAFDEAQGRWLLLWLFHHLVMDHVTMEVIVGEV